MNHKRNVGVAEKNTYQNEDVKCYVYNLIALLLVFRVRNNKKLFGNLILSRSGLVLNFSPKCYFEKDIKG